MACKTCVKLDIWRCLAIGLPPDIIHLNGSVHYFNHPAKGGTPISGKPYIINQSNISESSRKVGFPPSCSMSSGSCWAWVACKESWRVNGASVLLMLRVKNITIVYPTKSYIIVQVIWCIHIYILGWRGVCWAVKILTMKLTFLGFEAQGVTFKRF